MKQKYVTDDGKLIIVVKNNTDVKKKRSVEINNEELWRSMKIDDYVTLRLDDKIYLKSINRKLVYDKLTGVVSKKFKDNGNYFVEFQFNEIGRHFQNYSLEKWSTFKEKQRVVFKVNSNGDPTTLIIQ
ncbi:hypothetical protein [Paenibacillus chungangensis]|uniref:Uncharacterized protein n=1 Tax=Paenibacillus chungangensis TaxID=696535 RepID=A0ABW3HNV0_9BACL